jgi:hypothetical protein
VHFFIISPLSFRAENNPDHKVLIDERRFDMSRYDKNSEKYVIPMHRKNV